MCDGGWDFFGGNSFRVGQVAIPHLTPPGDARCVCPRTPAVRTRSGRPRGREPGRPCFGRKQRSVGWACDQSAYSDFVKAKNVRLSSHRPDMGTRQWQGGDASDHVTGPQQGQADLRSGEARGGSLDPKGRGEREVCLSQMQWEGPSGAIQWDGSSLEEFQKGPHRKRVTSNTAEGVEPAHGLAGPVRTFLSPSSSSPQPQRGGAATLNELSPAHGADVLISICRLCFVTKETKVIVIAWE